jgi:predicted extracellular nuclease
MDGSMKKKFNIVFNKTPGKFGNCFLWLALWFSIYPACLAQNSLLPIGVLRGVPSSDLDSFDVTPAFKGKSVNIQGVIHQRILWKGAQPDKPHHAFLIQNVPTDSDQDPNTSDGLFVYTGKESIPKYRSQDDYLPSVGDVVQLQGEVGHRYGQTELTQPRLIKVMRRHVDVASILPRVELDSKLHHELKRSKRVFESLEGMRVVLKAGAVVQSGRQFVGQGQDALFWVLPVDHPVSQRKPFFQNRTFRDAHPLDDIPHQRFDNGNGSRILLGSLGIKGHAQNLNLHLPAARTGDKLVRELVGGIVYSYSQYKFMPMERPPLHQGADPVKNVVKNPLPLNQRKDHFRIVSYNLENLYDHRDDPTDPCDASVNRGTANVRPPFNYLPSHESEYRLRLRAFASQIIHDMGGPELLLLQEVEDQDILTIPDGATEQVSPRPDGFPDVLQELSQLIHLEGGPKYRGVLNRSGADERGISCAFFYRLDRVRLKEMGDADDWIDLARNTFPNIETFGKPQYTQPLAIQADVYGSRQKVEKVYSRPSQLARFQFISSKKDNDAKRAELFVLNNHFSSRPQERVALRRSQAKLASVIATSLQKAFPDVSVMVGGDLNVFPRPDDPHPKRPSDQLRSLYEAGMLSAYDWVLDRQPANAYSYIYEGQAQTLDHCFLSNSLHQKMIHAQFFHVNADWPEFPIYSEKISKSKVPVIMIPWSLVSVFKGIEY